MSHEDAGTSPWSQEERRSYSLDGCPVQDTEGQVETREAGGHHLVNAANRRAAKDEANMCLGLQSGAVLPEPVKQTKVLMKQL